MKTIHLEIEVPDDLDYADLGDKTLKDLHWHYRVTCDVYEDVAADQDMAA